MAMEPEPLSSLAPEAGEPQASGPHLFAHGNLMTSMENLPMFQRVHTVC